MIDKATREESTDDRTAATRRQSAPGAIELKGVCKAYDGVSVVQGMDLRVDPGEFVTLLGPSGSGKTTTMMMIAGFERPSAGTILIEGAPVNSLPPKARNLGVVFQSYALFPHMSATDNVEFPLRMRQVPRGERRTRAVEALDRVGLSGFAERLPRQLSGGQQQRVALARALVFKPAALLLDEPMAALDRRLRETMQREIKEIQRNLGVSVVFITHDQAEAMAMSDRIVVMREGRIVQEGAPADVYLHPETDWIANFLGDTNLLPCTVLRRHGETATVDLGPYGVADVKDRSTSAEGHAFAVSIRPEHVILQAPAEVGVGTRGTLVSSTHLGATVLHQVRIGADNLSVVQLSGEWDPAQRQGDPVRVGWRTEHAQLLLLDT